MRKLKKNVIEFLKANIQPRFVEEKIEGIQRNGTGGYLISPQVNVHGVTFVLNIYDDDFDDFDPKEWNPLNDETLEKIKWYDTLESRYIIKTKVCYWCVYDTKDVEEFLTCRDIEKDDLMIKQITNLDLKNAFDKE